jgi:hypothetical protein
MRTRTTAMLSKPGIFDDASPSHASLTLEDYIQPTLNHGLRVWWAYYWPTSLISACLIATMIVALRIAWQNALVSGNFIRWANGILPYVVTYAISLFIIHYLLAKRFRHFRVALLPRDISSTEQSLPRTFPRTIRVWWAFSWRAVVLSVIVRFAGGIAIGFVVAALSLMGPVMTTLVPIVAQIIIDAAVGLFVMYSAILDEEFGDFRVALLPRKDAAAVAAAAPTPSAAP